MDTAAKPVLYQGRHLPLTELSASDFETFVYLAFVALGPPLGFEVRGKTGAGGDGGFDIWGDRHDRAIVCIQCKRWQHVELNDAAVEFAKVALSTFLDNSNTREHIIVASGTLAKNLHVALREANHSTLIERAIEQADKAISALRDRVVTQGGTPSVVIREYIAGLTRLEVWAGDMFDARLGLVWTTLQSAIERTFAVNVVLREYPRPDFDEPAYLHRLSAPVGIVAQTVIPAKLPPNIRKKSAASPRSAEAAEAAAPSDDQTAVNTVLATSPGACVILSGPGGGGKTSAMELAASEAGAARSSDASMPLPILIALKEYRGDLADLVKRTLGILHGHWQSIAGGFLLLLDGINEMAPIDAQQLTVELTPLLTGGRVAVVITCRDSGPSRPIVVSGITASWAFSQLSIQQIRDIAAIVLPDRRIPSFMDAVLRQLRTTAGARLFSLPFVVRVAAESFGEKETLQVTLSTLIDEVLTHRFQRNQELDIAQGAPDIPETTLRALAAEVAYDLRLVRRRLSVPHDEIQQAVRAARIAIAARETFGADELTDTGSLAALLRHEYLTRSQSDYFGLSHDLISGFLAAGPLAARWRLHLDDVHDAAVSDAWLFALGNATNSDREQMFRELVARDPILAANGAVESGLKESFADIALASKPQEEDSHLAWWYWMAACATLGTGKCIEELRSIFEASEPDSPRYNQAQHALCDTGDLATLRAVLPEADFHRHRGMEMKGGEEALWKTAPPAAALSVARDRIESSDEYEALGESVLALARFGELADADRLETLIARTLNLDTLLYAADALSHFSTQRACDALERVIERVEPPARISACHWLSGHGGHCNTPWLIDILLASTRELANTWTAAGLMGNADAFREATGRQHQTAQVLKGTPLSEADIERLQSAFATADRLTRSRIWSIVREHRLPALDAAAFAVIENSASGPFDDVGAACNLALERDWSDDEHQRFMSGVLAFAGRPDVSFTWDLSCALSYLLARGALVEVTATIEQHLCAWLSARESLAAGKTWSLVVRGEDIATTPRYARTVDLDRVLLPFREIIGDVANGLPVNIRRHFLSVNTREGGTFECHRKIISGVPAEQLDDELELIHDPRSREFAIIRLAALGATPRRIAAWCRAVKQWHPVNDALIKAATSLWCTEVATALVDLVVRDQWPEELADHARESLKNVVLPFDRATLRSMLEPAIGRATADARNVLDIWAARARRRPSATTT